MSVIFQGVGNVFTFPNTSWYVYVITTTNASTAVCVATDASSNTYYGGNKPGTNLGTFYPLNNTQTGTINTALSGGMGYVVKYFSNGFPQFSYTADQPAAGNEYINQITVSGSNELFFSGNFLAASSNSNFKDSDGTTRVPTFGSPSHVIAKANLTGNVSWRALSCTTQTGSAAPVTADSSNAFIAIQAASGSSNITIANSDDTTFTTTVTNINGTGTKPYVVKYYSNGNVHWVLSAGALNSNDTFLQIACDRSTSSLYITGTQSNQNAQNYYLNNDGTGTPLFTIGGGFRGGLLKINPDGTRAWFANVTSSSTPLGSGVATDITGNVYQSGLTAGLSGTVINADGTTASVGTILATSSWVVKRDANGNAFWRGYQSINTLSSLCTDSTGAVYAYMIQSAGTTVNVYNSAVSPAIVCTLPIPTNQTPLIIKRLANGDFSWYMQISSSVSIPSITIQGGMITCDANDRLTFVFSKPTNACTITTGNASGTIDSLSLPAFGAQAGVCVKINSDGTIYRLP